MLASTVDAVGCDVPICENALIWQRSRNTCRTSWGPKDPTITKSDHDQRLVRNDRGGQANIGNDKNGTKGEGIRPDRADQEHSEEFMAQYHGALEGKKKDKFVRLEVMENITTQPVCNKIGKLKREDTKIQCIHRA